MQQGVLALVLGVVGGVAGAFLVTQVLAPSSPDGAAEGPARNTVVADRLDALEAQLEERGLLTARLQGHTDATNTALPLEMRQAIAGEVEEVFAQRIEPRMEAELEARLEEFAAEAGASEEPTRPRKKRLALAEVAREVGLSASEEDALRRIYAESSEKYLELFAGEDGDVEQVRADFENFRSDEKARPALMAKYIPRLLPNIGGMMAIEATREAQVAETLGSERSGLLDDYDIIEERPFEMGGGMGFEARAGR